MGRKKSFQNICNKFSYFKFQNKFRTLLLLALLALFQLNCKTKAEDNKLLLMSLFISNNISYSWNLPPGFPAPNVPSDNPMSVEKVKLGRFLFYDKKLSENMTQSCSSCHIQALAFSDGRELGIGSTGQTHPRSAQQLSNVAYHPVLTWSDPTQLSLEIQSKAPLFGTSPIELGLSSDTYLNRIKGDSIYRELFSNAFGVGLDKINEQNIRFALASFQRTLISGNSPYDKVVYQSQSSAMSASAKRGMNIFNGEVAECFHCHGGFNFTDTSSHTNVKNGDIIYNDNGFRSLTSYNSLSDNKKGLYATTGKSTDIGKFRAPSLRNVGLTFPYMHDGSIHCDTNLKPTPGVYSEECAKNALGKVIEHYKSGGQTPSNKDTTLIRGFTLTQTEKDDLINFLLSLTDQEFISNKEFSNPF